MDHGQPFNISHSPAEEVRAAPGASPTQRRRVLRALGLGLITGAADADCSAIGTYASTGAKLGPSFLWTAPVTLPMMVAVVYLSAKLGQVAGQGLFQAINDLLPALGAGPHADRGS